MQGLTVDDFEVFDNGVRQSLRAVSFDAVPLDVSLVLELSDPRLFSTRRPRPPYAPAQTLRDAAEISAALRGIDRLRVMVVYAEPFEVIPLRAPGAPARPLVRQWENTDITSALYDGTAAVIVRPTPVDRRHLVFLFTDGVDGTSVVDGELLLQAAPTTDAVIHVARRLTGPEIFAQEDPRSNSRYPVVWPAQPRLIEQVAVATGGTVRQIDTESVAAHFQNVLKTFSQRYLLHFTPTDVPASGWHELAVKVRGRPRYRVEARRGYFAGQ